jgi:hypothetical protein
MPDALIARRRFTIDVDPRERAENVAVATF